MKKFLLIVSILLLANPLYAQSQDAFAEDKALVKIRIDRFDGGQNSADLDTTIEASQSKILKNIIITSQGRAITRKGQALFSTDESNTAFTGLGRFTPSATVDNIVIASDTSIAVSDSDGTAWATINDGEPLTTGKDTEFIQANTLLFALNGTDPTPFYDGTFWDKGAASDTSVVNASPPTATTGAWQLNYLFLAGNPSFPDFVFVSNNLNPAVFTAGDVLFINTGDGQKVIHLESFRVNELIIYKERSIFVLDLTGEEPIIDWTVQPLSKTIGCIASRSVVNTGNDHWFLSSNPIAVRSLVRTQFDKILLNKLSIPIQDIFDGTGNRVINESVISKATAILFDDKYFLAIPTGNSTVNDFVVYYDFTTQSWGTIDGWFPADWLEFDEELFYIDALDGRVIKCFTGTQGDMASGPTVTTSSEPSIPIRFEIVSKDFVFDNAENFKMPDALEVEFGTTGSFTATVSVELDDGGFQDIGTINLAGDSPTLPVTLPFTLATDGVARKIFQTQSLGEFRKIAVKISQETLDQFADLHSYTNFSKLKRWRRE
jgi:hypothetical protein